MDQQKFFFDKEPSTAARSCWPCRLALPAQELLEYGGRADAGDWAARLDSPTGKCS